MTSFFVHHCLCTCEMSDLNNKSTNAITGKSTEANLQELLESISSLKRDRGGEGDQDIGLCHAE